MKVSSIMHPDPITCRTIDTCKRAARLMSDYSVGCLPVIDDHGHIAGFITDRDVCMAALAHNAVLGDIPVSGNMTTPVHTCRLDDSVDVAERLMSKFRVRRLAVVNDMGLPVGILSLDDLARAFASQQVPSTEVASTFAAVVTPEHGNNAR